MREIILHFKTHLNFYWGWLAGFCIGAGLMLVIFGD